jgi:hypothetical protein
VVEDDDSALLSRVQDDPAIHGVTESLFASRVTDSLYVRKLASARLTTRNSHAILRS